MTPATSAHIVGAPTLRLTYTGTVPAGTRPTRVFAQLVDPSTGLVLGNQITPIAYAAPRLGGNVQVDATLTLPVATNLTAR